MSNAQTSNIGDRIGKEFLDPSTGVKPNDDVMHSLGKDIAEETRKFDLRIRVDRGNAFTQLKSKHEKDRDDYLKAFRRGLRTILAEPVQAVLPARREAAQLLLGLLDRRPKNFEMLGAGENTTHLNYLFADCDTPAAQRALQETDLLRFYTPLKKAQADFVEVVRQQEAAEAEAASLPPAENPKNLPRLRDIKLTLAKRLSLAMENLDYLASRGLPPYVALAERCARILTEAGLIAKARQTRAANKAAKGSEAELTN